ncbi:MAG: hypothetical protein HY016_05265 [Nitrosomonadales bacterium]|nr:hypothetical protein [Nitrosomonadales bacterium]
MQFHKALRAIFVLLSAIFWTNQAQAIPAFARQTGMACSACHQQHFPALNSFGRAFKQSGYTMVGAQALVEGEQLSLPVVLNAAFVGYMQYQQSNGFADGLTPVTKNTNNGQTQIPQQVSLFVGGRVGEHIGFEGEINIAGAGVETAGSTGVGLIRVKIPFVFDVGNVKAGVIPFSTNGLGVADSFEVLNTGAVAVHTFNQTSGVGTMGGMQVISAQQYLGTATAASGSAFVVSNEKFFLNLAKWGANYGDGKSGGPTSSYLRAAWTPGDLIPGFDAAIGVQLWRGYSAVAAPAGTPVTVTTGTTALTCTAPSIFITGGGCITPAVAPTGTGVVDTQATSIDAQLLGEVGGMPLTFVASYATAPANDAASVAAGTLNPNLFNQGAATRKSLNLGAELGVIPGKATLQLGIRRANSGLLVPDATGNGIAGSNATDNAIMLGATYNLALNVRTELTYTKASGDLYNGAVGSQNEPGNNKVAGDRLVTFDLAFGF